MPSKYLLYSRKQRVLQPLLRNLTISIEIESSANHGNMINVMISGICTFPNVVKRYSRTSEHLQLRWDWANNKSLLLKLWNWSRYVLGNCSSSLFLFLINKQHNYLLPDSPTGRIGVANASRCKTWTFLFTLRTY